jgi:hypothetical protein
MSRKIVGVIKASLSIDGSYAHGKTLKPIPSLVNVDLIEKYKNHEGVFQQNRLRSRTFLSSSAG